MIRNSSSSDISAGNASTTQNQHAASSSTTTTTTAPTRTTAPLPFSNHRCVESDIVAPAPQRWISRTCLFYNLYYHPRTERFYYYHHWANSTNNGGGTTTTARDKIRFAGSLITSSGYMVKGKALRRAFHQFAPVVVQDEKTIDQDISNGKQDAGGGITINASRVSTVASPAESVFVLYKPSYDFNFGHYVFDTVLSIFSMLDLFGLSGNNNCGGRHQHVPVFLEVHHGGNSDPFFRCHRDARWPMCAKMYKRVMAGILGVRPEIMMSSNATTTTTDATSGEPSAEQDVDIPRTSNLFGPVGGGTTTDPPLVTLPEDTDMVLLPRVITGPGRMATVSCEHECTVHRASQMHRFRAWLWTNLGLPPPPRREQKQNTIKESSKLLQSLQQRRQPPNAAAAVAAAAPAADAGGSSGEDEDNDDEIVRITVSLPIGNSHVEDICQFTDGILPALQTRFGTTGSYRVNAVNMASLTVQEQALAVASSTMMISNQGGGSASSFFLPRGATLILFYWNKVKVLRMDHELYGTTGGHFNVQWVNRAEYCTNTASSARKFVELVEDILQSNRLQLQQHANR